MTPPKNPNTNCSLISGNRAVRTQQCVIVIDIGQRGVRLVGEARQRVRVFVCVSDWFSWAHTAAVCFMFCFVAARRALTPTARIMLTHAHPLTVCMCNENALFGCGDGDVNVCVCVCVQARLMHLIARRDQTHLLYTHHIQPPAAAHRTFSDSHTLARQR